MLNKLFCIILLVMYDIVFVMDTANKEKVKGTVYLYVNIILLQLLMANNILAIIYYTGKYIGK